MESSKNQVKKRTQLSVIIREPTEKFNRSGVNCIKFEDTDRLFTAGRDSIIRVYSNLASPPPTNPSTNDNSFASVSSTSFSSADHFYQMSLSHHTDWVNDIVLCKNSRTLISASNDTTVKIWNTTKGNLLSTLRLHKDYVKCLAYARDKDLVASAGFDKNIFIWDISTGVAVNSSSFETKNINDNKYSIYSLAMNSQGTVLASGSPENCVRIWDPRTCAKAMKLKGHSHNIRALVLNKDGTQCLSASSDHTIRIWSLGQQRCISTIEMHTEGVWALSVNDAFTKVYSAGKDCKVFATDLRNLDESVLVCEETAPVLSMDFGRDEESLWISTTNSSIKNWSLKANAESCVISTESRSPRGAKPFSQSNSLSSGSTGAAGNSLLSSSLVVVDQSSKSSNSSLSISFLMQNPLNSQAQTVIKGTTSIKQYHILNDKRYIVTKDTEENVCVWDVLQAKKIESLGKENYENAIKQRQRFISVPNWFSVDLKLGLLTINLDENEWNSAWVNFKDMDSNHVRSTQNIDLSDAKVNYGCIFLESLFKTCLFINPLRIQTCTTAIYNTSNNNNSNSNQTKTSSEEEPDQAGLLRFNIPEHTPIIFSEVAGRTLHRTEARELCKESEQETLSNVMPLWIIDALVNKNTPKFNKIVFVLNPFNQSQNKPISKDRLSSIDLLQVKKLKEHVYQKILKLDENANSQQMSVAGENEPPGQQKQSNSTNSLNNNNNNNSNTTSQNDMSAVANRSIELICSDTLLNDPEMNLRTIKHLIWKGSGDLTILYRVKS